MDDITQNRQLGPYRLDSVIGRGGMGVVYKAYQETVDRYVALKVISTDTSGADFSRRFRQEARVLARLQHPNILPLFDFGEGEGYAYLVMPLMAGGTLASKLTEQPTEIAFASRVLSQLADALDYAHAKGVVHRDIKPNNVLLGERDHCMLADFGIARLTEAASGMSLTNRALGTPEYMSPEQARGDAVGPASDIYGLGVLAYRLVTGRVPFKAASPVAVGLMHLTADVPPPSQLAPVSLAIEQAVLNALARSPVERFRTAAEFSNAFSAAASSSLKEPPTAHPTLPIESTPDRPVYFADHWKQAEPIRPVSPVGNSTDAIVTVPTSARSQPGGPLPASQGVVREGTWSAPSQRPIAVVRDPLQRVLGCAPYWGFWEVRLSVLLLWSPHFSVYSG